MKGLFMLVVAAMWVPYVLVPLVSGLYHLLKVAYHMVKDGVSEGRKSRDDYKF